jgi:hypothetical protein
MYQGSLGATEGIVLEDKQVHWITIGAVMYYIVCQ